MQPVLELRDDAEIAAPATQSPEQVLVLSRAGCEQPPIGGDDVSGQEVVAR
jgi:hypothetical protein